MNQSEKDRVIALAKECGIDGGSGGFESGRYRSIKEARENSILAFAEALMAEQRECDAKICESMKPRIYRTELYYQECADTIRANKE